MEKNCEERRSAKRAAAVRAVKRSPDYFLIPGDKRPPPPDPEDGASKRQWERSMQAWRQALREMLRKKIEEDCK